MYSKERTMSWVIHGSVQVPFLSLLIHAGADRGLTLPPPDFPYKGEVGHLSMLFLSNKQANKQTLILLFRIPFVTHFGPTSSPYRKVLPDLQQQIP